MNYQAKQEELDKIKWVASEQKGADACGDFDYCAACDKNEEFPCAKAVEKSSAKSVKTEVKSAPKASAPKAAAAKSAAPKTAAVKKAPAKK